MLYNIYSIFLRKWIKVSRIMRANDHNSFCFCEKGGSMTHGFGDRLVSIRSNRNVSQIEMAQALGVNRRTQYMYESDKRVPTLLYLQRLSQEYKVDLNYLINGKSFYVQ